jgi:hypothetical protein
LSLSSVELGDFQTPVELVRAVMGAIEREARSAVRVLEPACGEGAFVRGLLELNRRHPEIKAFELQREHLAAAAPLAQREDADVELREANLFETDLRSLRWRSSGPLLVIGNPPWITSSALGAMDSGNVPTKRNLLQLSGLDALTGASNFDLTEYVWWKLLTELADEQPTICLLSKTSVARRVFELSRRLKLHFADVRLYRIDARRWFGAAVDACCFVAKVRPNGGSYVASVYDELDSERPTATMGFVGENLVADVAAYRATSFLEGRSAVEWRQGVKHDLAAVMELRRTKRGYTNGLGESVDVEPTALYPLLKSSDVFRSPTPCSDRLVLITQRSLQDDPQRLSELAPKAWKYLMDHAALLDARKSSIYRNRPRFAIFGIGDYSFSPYKVAIAGLYKQPRFRMIGPIEERPVMVDDTCYLISATSAAEAALLCAVFNRPETRQFIDAVAFWDSKRPVTKKLLQRVDVERLIDYVGVDAIQEDARVQLSYVQKTSTEPDWRAAAEKVLGSQLTLART